LKKSGGLFGVTLILIAALVACASQPSAVVVPTRGATNTPPKTSAATSVPPTSVSTSTPLATKTEAPSVSACDLEPVVVPTRPAETPGYTELDPATGLHMTGTVQEIDLESYRLEVTGRVDHPLSLTYDDLRCLPRVETAATLKCPGFFVDKATWAGTPIREVLALAGVQEGATSLSLVSADGYSRQVPISEELSETGFLAYEWEGEPLPILHGFPVRVVLPEASGGSWVKWLVAIEVN
jgi:DMSO/TMAO reductase YedYZ molybdopterin-dependent catalytic subunit